MYRVPIKKTIATAQLVLQIIIQITSKKYFYLAHVDFGDFGVDFGDLSVDF